MKPLSASEFLEEVLRDVPEVSPKLREDLRAIIGAVGKDRPGAIRRAFEKNHGS